jgi:chitosanase
MAWELTSLYENSTTVLQYAYCENIEDNRGYTVGRAGFCTGTGDAIQVVLCLDGSAGRNRMTKYLPVLAALGHSGETHRLDAIGPFCADWSGSATDPATAAAFARCQDGVALALYQAPACEAARAWGITSALFLAELYDAWINHGSAAEILQTAGRATGIAPSGKPLARSVESRLLSAFLTRRLDILRTDATWAADVDRVAPFEAARRASNFDFVAPVDTSVKAASLWPHLSLKDSGQPACILVVRGATVRVTGDPACTSAAGR